MNALNLLMTSSHTYMCHDSLEEQKKYIVLAARRKLISHVKSRPFYFLIADEATDVAKTSQMSFSLRYCDDDYDIHEEFVGIRRCDDGMTATKLLCLVKDSLIRFELDYDNLVGLALDGCSTMKALANLVKAEINSDMLYIHCFAHCNELTLKDTTKGSILLENGQLICENLYALAGVSPKRVILFEKFRKI